MIGCRALFSCWVFQQTGSAPVVSARKREVANCSSRCQLPGEVRAKCVMLKLQHVPVSVKRSQGQILMARSELVPSRIYMACGLSMPYIRHVRTLLVCFRPHHVSTKSTSPWMESLAGSKGLGCALAPFGSGKMGGLSITAPLKKVR